MRFSLIYIFIFVLLFSCTQNTKTINKKTKIIENTFSSKGFALIYIDSIYETKIVNKKLSNEQNYVLHTSLRNNRMISITNPLNSKFLVAKVKKVDEYPSIYNIVITKKMAEDLNLDINNPYVEILTIKENDKFIAKKAAIYEEERNVANKVPITSIDINDLSASISKNVINQKKPSYIIDIGDFYFYESAETVKNRFKKEANLTNIKIKKISQNKFKLYSGPYDSFNSMKETYLSLNELGFDELNIINKNK